MFSIVLGVTGHRDVCKEQNDSIIEKLQVLLDDLWAQFPKLNIRIITGMASGADTLITQHAIKLFQSGKSIEVVTVLPMHRQEYMNDFYGEELKKFNSFLAQLECFEWPIIELPFCEVRNECYANLGSYLKHKSDILISVWNGVESNAVGGTADVTHQYLRPLCDLEDGHHVDDVSMVNNALYNAGSKVVYHIKVNRVSDIEKKYRSVVAEYIFSKNGAEVEKLQRLPEKIHSIFTEISLLNDEVTSLREKKNSEIYRICETDLSQHHVDLNKLDKAFSWIDLAANNIQRKVLYVHIQAAIISALILAFLTGFNKSQQVIWLGGYVVLFVLGFTWYKLVAPNTLKAKYTFYRALAETLRIEFFFRARGVIEPEGRGSLTCYLEAQGEVEEQAVNAIVRQLTLLGTECEQATFSQQEASGHWLIDQQNYYQRTIKRLENKRRKYSVAIKTAFYFPIILILLMMVKPLLPLLASTLFMGVALKEILIALISLLPIFGTLIALYRENLSLVELTAQYRLSNNYLNKLKAVLSRVKTAAQYNKVIKSAGVHLSREHMSWMLITKNKKIKPN